jgi:hypothetical protein
MAALDLPRRNLGGKVWTSEARSGDLAGKIRKVRLLAHLTLLENSKKSSDDSNSGTPDITISEFQIPSEGLPGIVLKKIQGLPTPVHGAFTSPQVLGFPINGEW